MAKKVRRKKAAVLTQAQLEGTSKNSLAPGDKVVVETPTPAPREKETVNWEEEYYYVVEDLRRVGVLAAFLLAVLVGLNLILN